MKTEVDRQTLSAQARKELAAHRGPCLSLLVPPYRPGAGGESREATLKSLVQHAAAQAEASRNPDQANQLVLAAKDVIRNPDVHRGGAGICIFLAPGFQASYSARVYEAQASLGSYFLLRPLLVDLLANQDMLVLTLSTKHLRLFQYHAAKCNQIPLPANVPNSLNAHRAAHGEPPLSNRKAAGASMQGSSIHVGATEEHDWAPSDVEAFFERVDSGLQTVLAWRPLLLLGVHEEMAAYQRVSRSGSSLLIGRPGNADYLSLTQIEKLAREAEIADFYQRSQAVLSAFSQKTKRALTANDIHEVLDAAAEGRVHDLCIRAATPVLGKLPDALDRAGVTADDLVNAAVVETLRSGGDVFVAPLNKMPEEQPMAAILRF